MRTGCARGWRVLALGLTVVSSIMAQDATDREDAALYRRIALGLVDQALALAETDHQGRETLARRAREIDPSLADPLILLAQERRGLQSAVRERRQLLEEALTREFVRFDRDAAIADLARLYLDHRREHRAFALLDGALRATDGADPLTAILSGNAAVDERRHLYLRSLLATHDPWYAGSILEAVRTAHPRNTPVAILAWEREPTASLRFLEWVDAMESEGRDVPPELFREVIRGDPGAPVQARLYRRYRAAGGTDPLVHLLARLEGVGDDGALSVTAEEFARDKLLWEAIAAATERVAPAAGGGSTTDIRATIDLAGEPAAAALALLEAGEHHVDLDRDRDGYVEERYHFTAGTLTAWQVDADENGVSESAVVIDGRRITVYVWDRDFDRLTEISYSAYPMVSRVRWDTGEDAIEWVPAHPVPADAGIPVDELDGLWNTLTRRVTVDREVARRFDRQRSAPSTQSVAPAARRELRNAAAPWERVP